MLCHLTLTDPAAFACLEHVGHLTITLGMAHHGREISELTKRYRDTLTSLCLVGNSYELEDDDAIYAFLDIYFPRLEHLVIVALEMGCRNLNYLFFKYRHQLKTVRLRQVQLLRHRQAVVSKMHDDAKLAISELRKAVLEELKMHDSFVQVGCGNSFSSPFSLGYISFVYISLH